jgi:hypothetical protein
MVSSTAVFVNELIIPKFGFWTCQQNPYLQACKCFFADCLLLLICSGNEQAENTKNVYRSLHDIESRLLILARIFVDKSTKYTIPNVNLYHIVCKTI